MIKAISLRPVSSAASVCALFGLLLLIGVTRDGSAQELRWPEVELADDASVATAVTDLARAMLAQRPDVELSDRFRLELAAESYEAAAADLAQWRADQRPLAPGRFEPSIALEVYIAAKVVERRENGDFRRIFVTQFSEVFRHLDDEAALEAGWYLGTPLRVFDDRLATLLTQLRGPRTLTPAEALGVIRAYVMRQAMRGIAPSLNDAIATDSVSRYAIDEDVLIKTPSGATLSAVVVRKNTAAPQPASLWFNIYTSLTASLYEAKRAALEGYVGVAVDPRGKRLSQDRIQPWESEGDDLYAVCDWISKQPWSDGQIGMYGHSHGGFAAWAAVKRPHPALKTIVPSSASQPGLGLPMENNVFLFANYAWPFYVMNNRTVDEATFFDRDRWRRMRNAWYATGKPFRSVDAIDGVPNPLLQRQLQHPSFDRYYQAMQPYGKDYAKLDLPVLSITGYYDDANASAVNYMREHYRHNERAQHYLVIGPYAHGSTSRPVKPRNVKGYATDPVAQLDSVALTYAWFDYVMRGSAKPAFLKDRINHQVMGANLWRHAPTLGAMSNRTLRLYLGQSRIGERFQLIGQPPTSAGVLEQTVDFADRTTQNNLYPMRAIEEGVALDNGLAFISEPFDEPVAFAGQLSGTLFATLNKRDMDVTLALYELMPDGRLFYLSYYLGRASYAEDMNRRKLLRPGRRAGVPFSRTPLMSRQMSPGSRLLFLLTVNKNSEAQINYGTGKDVSDESIDDAKMPLQVQWHTDSFIDVPLWTAAATQ